MSNQMMCEKFESEIFGKLKFRKFNANASGRAVFSATTEDGRYIKFSGRQLVSPTKMKWKFLKLIGRLMPPMKGRDYDELVLAIVEHSIVDEDQTPPGRWYGPDMRY